MNILFLTQVLPYPPNAGPRIKTWNVLRFLVQRGHRISLVSYVRPEEMAYVSDVKQLVGRFVPVPIKRSRLADARDALLALSKGRSFLVERDDQAAMRRSVAREIEVGNIDAIHADQVSMTQFAIDYGDTRRVFDAHNATWAILERARSGQPFWLRPFLTAEMRAMRRYEGQIITSFDVTLAVTEADRKDLERAAASLGWESGHQPVPIEVIPITIDTDRLKPIDMAPQTLEILAFGSMHYAPNAEGIAWFLEEVFPLIAQEIPEVRMKVVGKNPPQRVRRLAASTQGSVEVTGYVEDLEPYFSNANAVVVPVLSGSGMRVRILEAIARGMPAVTTTLGAQGIDVGSRGAALIADSPSEFASAVVRVLRDPVLRGNLASRGRQLALDEYHWLSALAPLDAVYPPPTAVGTSDYRAA